MDVGAIKSNVRLLAQRERVTLAGLPRLAHKLLELATLVLAVEHYRRRGYLVSAVNLTSGAFVFKASGGRILNTSWFVCKRGEVSRSLFSNVQVQGAFSPHYGLYDVDVAIVDSAVDLARVENGAGWLSISDEELISFIEAKRLVPYPMLLAQFTGIVHEIMPRHVAPKTVDTQNADDFPPVLATNGHLSKACLSILRAWERRGYTVFVVSDVHRRLSDTLGDTESTLSPLHSD